MAVFIVLLPYLLTTKLRCMYKNNTGHTNLHDWFARKSFANWIRGICLGLQLFECNKTFDHQWILAMFCPHFYTRQNFWRPIAQKAVGPPLEISKALVPWLKVFNKLNNLSTKLGNCDVSTRSKIPRSHLLSI